LLEPGLLSNPGENRQARHPWDTVVEQDKHGERVAGALGVRAVAGEIGSGLSPVAKRHNRIHESGLLKDPFHQKRMSGVVFHYENGRRH
jgi:hypothetical protein